MLNKGFARTLVLTASRRVALEPLVGRLPASIASAPDGSRFLYVLPPGRGSERYAPSSR
ncbi:MAG: hypothetical protein ABR591_01125 [Candidatus Velthaea sp.]